jgi:hypothetical protein
METAAPGFNHTGRTAPFAIEFRPEDAWVISNGLKVEWSASDRDKKPPLPRWVMLFGAVSAAFYLVTQ